MNNLRTFETEEQYTSFKDSDIVIYPHVCYTKDTNKVFLKKEGIKEITFYINLYDRELLEYQAEEGMTWSEWCISKYNDRDWAVGDDVSRVAGNEEDWTFGGQYDVISESCGSCIIESKHYDVYKDGWGIGGGGHGE